jgi:hypothetical protein
VKARRHAFRTRITDDLSRLLKHLQFLDESGFNLGMTRLFGRAEPGVRGSETTPDNSGPHNTVIAAMSLKGISAPWILEGAMDTAACEAYVESELAKTLRRGDLVRWDNLSAHKSEQAASRLKHAVPSSSFCRRTRPTSTRSNCAGRRSRRLCARLRRARSTTCGRPWLTRCDRSRPLTLKRGSHIVVTPYRKLNWKLL